MKFLDMPVPEDQNGGLTYSHLENSTIIWFSSSKLGMIVKNEKLEDRGFPLPARECS